MKKIFYIFLLMISSLVWGQIADFNNLCINNSNLSLDNTYYDFKFKTPIGCSQDQNSSYKSINYYKVVTGGSFEFVLRSSKLVNFHVWILSETELSSFFLNKESRYNAVRSSYTVNNNEKGLFNTITDECEFYGAADGKLKPIDVAAGQYVVIGVLGADINTNFTISSGGTATVCEPEPERGTLDYNNKCVSDPYKLADVKNDIKANIASQFADNTIDVNKIKLFVTETSISEKTSDIVSADGPNQTYYAKVYDDLGRLKYIYKLTFYFRAPHNFNSFFFNGNSELRNFNTCSTVFKWKGKRWYLYEYLNLADVSDYDILYIKYVDKNGVNQRIDDPENSYDIDIPIGGTLILEILVKSVNPLKCDNQSFINQSITNNTLTLNDEYSMNVCEGSVFNYDEVLRTMFPAGYSGYELITSRANNSILNFGTETELVIPVKVKYGLDDCITREVNIRIKKTSPANIANAEIKNICLDDFSQADVNNAITTIQNGNLYQLKYYQTNGTSIAFADLFTYIKTTKQGKIIVKALASENTAICDTEVELTFNLGVSSFVKVDNIPTLNSTCAEVGTGYIFTKTEIETYLKSKLGRADITFEGVGNETLADNASTTIRFKVKLNSESCWSEEMILKLQVITKPNVINASRELQADCDNLIIINESILKDLFGVNSTTIYDYEILHNNSTPLIFDTSGKAEIRVIFKNKLAGTCFVEKTIIVNKKPTLITPPSLNADIEAKKIVYCEDNIDAAKTQLTTLLNYIKSTYNLEARITVEEIFNQFIDDENFVEVVFYNPNSCGEIKLKIGYKKNGLPNIIVPAKGLICTDTLFELDFTTQTDYANYNYSVEKADGTRIIGIDNFHLDAGTYKVTIEDKITLCSVVKTLVVENSPEPILEKITVNEKSIIVTAKGSGKLEYALFDETGNIVVAWQTNNELIIPENITNNNFTVKVRLNNCGVVTYTNIIYLALPSFISPNNDGKNDFWQAMTKNGKVNDTTNSYRLIIFDRYGKQFLNKEGIDIIKWDGMHLGKPVADGTYWYLLEPIGESGVLQVKYTGSIVVKRKIN